MKTSFRIRTVFLILSCVFSMATVQAAQYYVVIGSFVEESNARRFTGAVRESFQEVSYTFIQSKKLYYVHVLRTSRKEEARKWSLYLRREKGFKDAWVLTEAGPADQQVTTANHQRPRFQSSFASAFHASMPASAAPELSVRKKIDAGITAARIVIAGICGCRAGNPSRIRRIERRRLVDCSG